MAIETESVEKNSHAAAGYIRTAICDDNSDDLSAVKGCLERYSAKKSGYTFQIDAYTNPALLLEAIKNGREYDLLLLDIYMPVRSGVQVAKELRRSSNQCEIIFITTSDDHAQDAYNVNAIQYIKKPVAEDDLFRAVDRVLVQLAAAPSPLLLFKTTDGLHRLNASDIICSKAKLHYQHITLIDGTLCIVRMTVGELFDMLSVAGRFMRIGSVYIISVYHVVSIDTKKITMKNSVCVPLLRNTYRSVKQEYLDIVFGEA